MRCLYHCCSNVVNAEGHYCSRNCRIAHAVHLRRKRLKVLAVAYMGDTCCLCSYDRCVNSLEFHHIDPSQKDFGIAQSGATRSWESIKAELHKCVMVCKNCHGEIHAGLHDHVDLQAMSLQQCLSGVDLEPVSRTQAKREREMARSETKSDKESKKRTRESTRIPRGSQAERFNRRKVIRPTAEHLQKLIDNFSWSAIGRMYGVSDTSAKKWAKGYGLAIPNRRPNRGKRLIHD